MSFFVVDTHATMSTGVCGHTRTRTDLDVGHRNTFHSKRDLSVYIFDEPF